MSQLDWGWGKKLALVRQTENAECGVACLAMIANWHGHKISLRHLRAKFGITQHGMSFSRLIECAELLNLSGRPVRLELEELDQLRTPCILHWNLNHFVVLNAVKRNKVIIHDPANGIVMLTLSEVNKHFTGIALELSPTHDFIKRDEKELTKLSELIGKTIGLKTSLIKIFTFALVLEALALLLPMLNQIVIDEVLVGYDDNLLVLIIFAILLITAAQTLISLVSAAVLWFGANSVLSGQFTIGMLIAFLSYQARFSGSISSLIDKYFEYKMLAVYNERLADIVLTDKEQSDDFSLQSNSNVIKVESDVLIDFSNITFSYGTSEPLLLSNASFQLMKEEIVALVGPSGCGKSTISKLLLGIYKPTSGCIRFFGDSNLSIKDRRLRIGSVLQEDQLFSGSVLENITSFSNDIDEDWVVECAQKAGVHNDIEQLNMGYHTLVGEMGAGLSGGQKQRILIARALYKKPQLLILDEATSSLDIQTESFVCNSFKAIGLPILMIAHRPETIASADRVLMLSGGCITEVTNFNHTAL